MANKKIDSIKKAGSSLDKLFSGASESVTEPTKKTISVIMYFHGRTQQQQACSGKR